MTLRVFDRKDCYSVHGPAAVFIASSFHKTTSVVKYMGAGPTALAGVTLNRPMFETVLRALLLDGVPILLPDTSPTGASQPQLTRLGAVELWEERGRGSWSRVKWASPGRLGAFEEDLFRTADCSDAPVLASVRVVSSPAGKAVGLAYLNATARELGATSFVDDDQFSALEAALAQLGAKECVIPALGAAAAAASTGDVASAAGVEAKRLRECLSRANCLPSELKASEFSSEEATRSLRRLLKTSEPVEMHRPLLEREGGATAAAALGGLIRFAELEAESGGQGKYTLLHHDIGRHMRLDGAALRALHVLKEQGGGASSVGSAQPDTGFSLYALLNRCKTPMGKRLLHRWLKQPLVDVAAINARLDVVSALASDPELRDALRNGTLRALPDVERLARKLERQAVSLQDLCRLYQASCALPVLAAALGRHEGQFAAVLDSQFAQPLNEAHGAEQLAKFEGLIEAAVDLDKVPDEYLIVATYDTQLAELDADKQQLDEDIQTAFAEAARALGLEKDKVLKLDHSPQLGWFLRLTKKEEASVRDVLQARFVQLEARKDGVKFTSKALKKASDARTALGRQYAQQQKALVTRVVDVAASYSDLFLQAAGVLAQLDVLAAFADVAATSPVAYVRPVLHPAASSPGGGGQPDMLRLMRCRHPCVEARGSGEYVPNDCLMAQGTSFFHVITGPNMGGKSTYLRSVAVCVLLAQCGCFVPCDEAELTVRDAIFCRVGAGDCTLRGVSTFMAEMLEAASILRCATHKSLVIIDELGRGTSTCDGLGLAWAIAQHLADVVQAPTVFATHFHEMTQLTGASGVVNSHVSAAADEAKRQLTMLYALRPGPCDQSFGIHCAEFARFPASVVDAARVKAAELEQAKGSDGGDTSSPVTPDVAAGAAAARAFLTEVAALGSGAAPERLAQAKAKLRAAAQGSQYLQALIAGA